VKNARALGKALKDKGYSMVSGGTDTHLLLWDLRPQDITGSKLETVCDLVSITLNKNSIYGDASAFTPGGVRVGTPALTSRGFNEQDFVQVAEFLDRAVKITQDIQSKTGKKIKEFKSALLASSEIKQLRNDVEEFSTKFYMPGFQVAAGN